MPPKQPKKQPAKADNKQQKLPFSAGKNITSDDEKQRFWGFGVLVLKKCLPAGGFHDSPRYGVRLDARYPTVCLNPG